MSEIRRVGPWPEMIVISVTLSILGAMILPRLTSQAEECALPRTTSDMAMIRSALAQYQLKNDRLPTDEEGLSVLSDEVPLDPWGRPYTYKRLGPHGFVLECFGADGEAGGSGQNRDSRWELGSIG